MLIFLLTCTLYANCRYDPGHSRNNRAAISTSCIPTRYVVYINSQMVSLLASRYSLPWCSSQRSIATYYRVDIHMYPLWAKSTGHGELEGPQRPSNPCGPSLCACSVCLITYLSPARLREQLCPWVQRAERGVQVPCPRQRHTRTSGAGRVVHLHTGQPRGKWHGPWATGKTAVDALGRGRAVGLRTGSQWATWQG